MASFIEQYHKANKITEKSLIKDLVDYIRRLENYLTDLNKIQIEYESEDIFHQEIGRYTYNTSNILSGKAGKRFKGIDTGDWLRGFKVKLKNEKIYFYSTDSKSNKILTSKNWDSNELFGLTDEHLEEVITEKLLPFFIQNLKNRLDI